MKKLFAILFIFITLSGCQRQVAPTPLPNDLFSQSEIEEINLMLQAFESVICDSDERNIAECYQAQYDYYDKYFKKGKIKVKPIESYEIERILIPLSQTTKSKLFTKQVTPYQDLRQAKFHNYQGNDSLTLLHVNEHVIYLSLIKDLAITCPQLLPTINAIQELGGTSFATQTHSILLSGSQNNYDQNIDRLLLAMHFIEKNINIKETTAAREIISKPLTDKLKARTAEREAKRKKEKAEQRPSPISNN